MKTPHKNVALAVFCRLCGAELKAYERPEEVCDRCLRQHIDRRPR